MIETALYKDPCVLLGSVLGKVRALLHGVILKNTSAEQQNHPTVTSTWPHVLTRFWSVFYIDISRKISGRKELNFSFCNALIFCTTSFGREDCWLPRRIPSFHSLCLCQAVGPSWHFPDVLWADRGLWVQSHLCRLKVLFSVDTTPKHICASLNWFMVCLLQFSQFFYSSPSIFFFIYSISYFFMPFFVWKDAQVM